MNMIVASSNTMATIMASSNDVAMILIKMIINGVVVRPMFQRTLRDIINRSKRRRMIVASRNDMATIIASSNAIAMMLINTVINGVVVRPMSQRTLREIITRSEECRMIVVSSSDMATIMVSSNAIVMIITMTDINRVEVRPMFQRILIDITTRSKRGRMIVANRNDIATIIASSNDIAMILIMTATN